MNTLRQRGMARREAIVEADKVRLRPILMTTAATTLGFPPMTVLPLHREVWERELRSGA